MITRRASQDTPVGRDRKGFTLVELMVAMMLFSVGLLALASSSAVVLRQLGEAGNMNIASSVAQTRIERLRTATTTCTTASTGTATTRGIAESWTVTTLARSAEIAVTATYKTTRGNRSQTYTSRIPCV